MNDSSEVSFYRSVEKRIVGELSDTERLVLIHGAIWFFLILASYYILTPIREQISSTYGVENLSGMFWGTFISMLVAIPLYSMLVGKIHRRWLVPSIYAFFIATLLLFYVAMRGLPEEYQVWVARVLFVWISVYGLFIVSFFWSVVGDMLSTAQGRRVFGVIASGGSLGALVGSQVARRLVGPLGVANLLVVPAVLLFVGLLVYFSLENTFQRSLSSADSDSPQIKSGRATGGNPFAGFWAVLQSKYLAAICLYGICMATCGTTVYFQQSEIVNAAFETQEARTEYFADVNFSVSIVTFVFQFLIVGWLMRTIGLGWTLATLPLAYVVGLTALAISPTIGVMAVISVIGRSAEYGLCNPAREVLFTTVNREDRYKAKSFIDTVVRRGGDSFVGSVYRKLSSSGGGAMAALSWVVIGVALFWALLSLFIGKENANVAARVGGE